LKELLFWVQCTSCTEYLGYFILDGAAKEAKKKHEAKTGHNVRLEEIEVKGEEKEQ